MFLESLSPSSCLWLPLGPTGFDEALPTVGFDEAWQLRAASDDVHLGFLVEVLHIRHNGCVCVSIGMFVGVYVIVCVFVCVCISRCV